MTFADVERFFIRYKNITTLGPFVPSDDREIDQARVQTAINNWNNSPKGSGNDNFFKFALDLRRAGMNKAQIETMLRSETAFGHSPNERKAQIPSIINSLQNNNRASRRRIV